MNEIDSAIRRSLSKTQDLKLHTPDALEFTLPKWARGLAGNAQIASEMARWHVSALSAVPVAFTAGALSTKSVQGGAVAAFGKGVTAAGRYLLEEGPNAYDRVRRAYDKGTVRIDIPLIQLVKATQEGRLIDTAFQIADGKIKTYSPADNLQDAPGGMILVPNKRDNYER